MDVIGIGAVDEDWGMGMEDGSLPWGFCREDLAWFKFITMNEHIVFGRKTYELIKDRLPRRHLHYISRHTDEVGFTQVLSNLFSFCKECKYYDRTKLSSINDIKNLPYKRVFVGGGVQIYKSAFENDLIDEFYLTRILKGGFNPTVFFPHELFLSKFKLISSFELSPFVIVERYRRKV